MGLIGAIRSIAIMTTIIIADITIGITTAIFIAITTGTVTGDTASAASTMIGTAAAIGAKNKT